MTNQMIFALDIGTRSVTGIILEEDVETKKYTVIDFCTKEHQKRSMLDGQIHDVIAVSEVIREVKGDLEDKHGKLSRVSVAAAGRALKTVQASSTLDITEQPITNQDGVTYLELSAVQEAQLSLSKSEEHASYAHYYCVGYSSLNYHLDGEVIGSLIDQKGQQASVEVIATFLPKIVVESLLAALDRADLTMDGLTLEPIAAINVLVPESMRRLNIALVDIGAGTSDIAITKDGTVTAYGMVPTAGDKITEVLSDHYLLDFSIAETSKRQIVLHGQDEIEDILGFSTNIYYDDLVDITKDSINHLASELALEINRLNDKSPSAVMLIGGGSLTPNIADRLAEYLELPDNRVAVRGIEAIQSLEQTDKLPTGPDYVTPIGIAISAQQNPVHYINVTVNDQTVRMFEMTELSVGDCLIQAGIQVNKHYGKPGLAKVITVNERLTTLPGGYGKPPRIYLNDQVADVHTKVTRDDFIRIEKGQDGEEPHVRLGELIEESPSLIVHYNGEQHQLDTTCLVNNKPADENYIIQDHDNVTINQPRTLEDFFTSRDTGNIKSIEPVTVTLNWQDITLIQGETTLLVNNEPQSSDYILQNQDRISVIEGESPTVKDLLAQEDIPFYHQAKVFFNGEPVTLKRPALSLKRDDIEITKETELMRDDHLEMTPLKDNSFIFQDVFRYVDIDLTKINGHFEVLVNNEPSSFHQVIQPGDHLEIKWN